MTYPCPLSDNAPPAQSLPPRRRRPPPPLLCLVHGSPALENLLTLGDQVPGRLYLLQDILLLQVILTDWKLAALGSSMADLSLLLLSSTDRETR